MANIDGLSGSFTALFNEINTVASVYEGLTTTDIAVNVDNENMKISAVFADGALDDYATQEWADNRYTPLTRTIAGFSLGSDITAQQLKTALAVPTVDNVLNTQSGNAIANSAVAQAVDDLSAALDTVRQSVPTSTSDLTNDGDGTSPFATEEYVDENGGKIDEIQVNGTTQPIVNKTVNVTVPTNSDYVDLSTAQTVGGTKTFTQPIAVGTTQYKATGVNVGGNEVAFPSSAGTLALLSNLTPISTAIDKNVINGLSFTYNGDTVTLVKSLINISSGVTSTTSEAVGLADTLNAGLMSPTTVAAIQTLTTQVAALQGQTVRLLYTASTNPTAAQISAFVTAAGYTENLSSIAVVVSGTFHIWHYYDNDGWRDDGLDTVNQWTNATAGIILGSELDGQIYAEDDGTGSVVGWSEVKTAISNAQLAITALNNALSNYYLASNPNGYISGITSADVVTALGFTPYNGATNPNGYITSAALSGYATQSWVQLQGYLVQSDLNNYATITQLNGKQDILSWDNAPTIGSTNAVRSGGVYTALQGKQDTLQSGVNLKTINNQSLLGSGDLEIGGTEVVANPSGAATADLDKVSVAGTIYQVAQVAFTDTSYIADVVFNYADTTTETLTGNYVISGTDIYLTNLS